jgi:thiamine-phosphate pyrophosphorylase
VTKIYLISPEKIIFNDFKDNLIIALKTGLIDIFQLRLKNYSPSELIKISQEIKKICTDYNCRFILNDFYQIAMDLDISGVHIGKEDGFDNNIIQKIKSQNPQFLVGVSCYDSRELSILAKNQNSDYISFGTFFPSITKNSQGKPTIDLIKWAKKEIELPIVAIGGINDKNCSQLIESKIDYLALISYVWQHPKGIKKAIINLDQSIQNASKIS